MTTDFEYDGQYLSDYGFIIGKFDEAGGTETVSTGAKITFNKISTFGGKRYSLSSAKYEECYSASFQIFKSTGNAISDEEYRDLVRWLNRREFLKFCFIDDNEACYYYASFTVEKIIFKNEIRALALTMETNSPFGYGQEQSINWTVGEITKVFNLTDISDEIGVTYPDMQIKINRAGTFEIYNALTDSRMIIKNCEVNETITIDGFARIITTDNVNHSNTLYDDFNFEFFKIGNTIDTRLNKVSFTLPCRVEIRYTPIIK